MATKTSVQSGYWSDTAVWGGPVPANGDAVIIDVGHKVIFDVDQSGFANGLLSLTINGTLCVDNFNSPTLNPTLKMNGNITAGANGRFFVGNPVNWADYTMEWALVPGKQHTWEVYPANDNCVEVLQDGEHLIEVATAAEVETTPGSFYNGNGTSHTWINPIGNDDPNDYTIETVYEIPRPVVGDEYRVYILLNSTGTINVPTIEMYGWYPDKEFTTLSANANSGQNQILLTEDLGLQQGDIIVISSGTENTYTAESVKGIYTVSAYDAGTKTVTLTANLGTNRLVGDYVAWYSRPIKLTRSSGTATLIPTKIDNTVFIGVLITQAYYLFNISAGVSGVSLYSQNAILKHCTQGVNSRMFAYGGNTFLVEDCTIAGHTWYGFFMVPNSIIKRCIAINGLIGYGLINCVIEDSIICNFTYVGFNGRAIKNIIMKNIGYLETRSDPGEMVIGGTIFSAETNTSWGYKCGMKFKNVLFKDNTVGYFTLHTAKCYNCLFEGKAVHDEAVNNLAINTSIESFNHNQIPDNYKAWCKGGTIETDEDKLLFNCGSAVYPVFRDFKYLAPANRTIKFPITLKKDTSNILAKIEIIDPTDDPLIDTSSSALATETADNNTDEQEIGINYKSSSARELILRISCMSSSGNVYVDVSRVEQMMSLKRIIN